MRNPAAMRQKYSDEPTNIIVVQENGEKHTFSALLKQEPGYLNFNKIELLGRPEDSSSAMSLVGSGLISWTVIEQVESAKRARFGTGFVRSANELMGLGLPPESVRPLGILEIFDFVEEIEWDESHSESSIVVWFLQRPTSWHLIPSSHSQLGEFNQHGNWCEVKAHNVKFRLRSISWLRRDTRINNEIEYIEIPAVELRNLDNSEDGVSIEKSGDLLIPFLNVLLASYYKQPFRVLERRERIGKKFKVSHQPIALESLRTEGDIRHRFLGDKEQFLSNGLSELARYHNQTAGLFGAVHGYYSSFTGYTIEEKLTSVVEGIEALVTLYEKDAAISRALVSSGTWRGIAKKLKTSLDSEAIDSEIASAIKMQLARPPVLNLFGRISRMVGAQDKGWTSLDREISDGIDRLISLRNKIVHGEEVDDYEEVFAETQRGQLIFERLFLSLCGDENLRSTGISIERLLKHEAS